MLELSKDKTIIITKADKGNAVVIQNKSDYLNKVQALLTFGGKFKELQSDEKTKRERKLQTYLGSLKKSEQMDEETHKLISDSRAWLKSRYYVWAPKNTQRRSTS